MGFFLKALAAIATADALDRHLRSRPTRYWYPNQPPAGTQQHGGLGVRSPAGVEPRVPGWDLEHPERPR
jgi:hypothetical protein